MRGLLDRIIVVLLNLKTKLTADVTSSTWIVGLDKGDTGNQLCLYPFDIDIGEDIIRSEPDSPTEIDYIWSGTEAQYGELGEYDPSTIYMIEEVI